MIKFLTCIGLYVTYKNVSDIFVKFEEGEVIQGKLVQCFHTYCDIKCEDNKMIFGVPRELIQNLGKPV